MKVVVSLLTLSLSLALLWEIFGSFFITMLLRLLTTAFQLGWGLDLRSHVDLVTCLGSPAACPSVDRRSVHGRLRDYDVSSSWDCTTSPRHCGISAEMLCFVLFLSPSLASGIKVKQLHFHLVHPRDIVPEVLWVVALWTLVMTPRSCLTEATHNKP